MQSPCDNEKPSREAPHLEVPAAALTYTISSLLVEYEKGDRKRYGNYETFNT
jgi:hypothetical protein